MPAGYDSQWCAAHPYPQTTNRSIPKGSSPPSIKQSTAATTPDSVLKLDHFSAFKANWEPKSENIAQIAKELNLGVDSFVFVDDNPAERARLYAQNTQRASLEQRFASHGEYLDSLEMTAEIDTFRPTYLERIAQLTNKSNQFNLTTRRYTLAEMESIANDDTFLPLYGRLADRFGDNGLVSIVIGRRAGRQLHIDLWLMSCRVLKRDMERAMLDALINQARAAGLDQILGYFLPTTRNGMVARHYELLGFQHVTTDNTGASVWSLEVREYLSQNRHIQVHGADMLIAR